MSRPQHATYGRILLSALASLVLVMLPLGSPASAVPPYTLEERATAVASPALIYIETQFTGYLRRRDTGEALHPNTIVVTFRCSGSVVNEQGFAVTSKQCVQRSPESIRDSAGHILVNLMIRDGKLTADQRDTFVKGLAGVVDFTGSKVGTPNVLKIFGQLFQGRSGLTAEPATQGEVVDDKTNPTGDLALIKFSQAGMPVVELSTTELKTNSSVVIVGFGTNDTATPVTRIARSKPAKVTGPYGKTTPPSFQMDGDLGADSLGGMVIDADGRIAGVVNSDPAARGANRLVINAAQITKALSNAGAANALAQTDQVYREALNAYFAGQYTESIKKFGNVLAVMPDHALATNYRQQATTRFAVEGDAKEPGAPTWLVVLAIVLGAVLIMTILVVGALMRRNRAQARVLRHEHRLMLEAYDPVSAVPLSSQPLSTQIWAPQQLEMPHPDAPSEQGHEGYPGNQGNSGRFGGFGS